MRRREPVLSGERPDPRRSIMVSFRSFTVRKCAVFCAGALVALALLPAPATAGTFSFVTPAGATTGGGPVSARADITTSDSGNITITLRNLQANPTDVAQLLSDFRFTTSGGAPGLIDSTLSSSSGQEITVNSGGTFSTGATVGAGWVYSHTDTVGTLDVLAAGGAGPAHLIIGPPGAGGTYSNANGSIAGNGPHNPLLNQSATFTIFGTLSNDSTRITGVTFSFGTTSGVEIQGVPLVAVPEPGSIALLATATGTLAGYFGWRRRKKIQAS
jgi:hypothetical protein